MPVFLFRQWVGGGASLWRSKPPMRVGNMGEDVVLLCLSTALFTNDSSLRSLGVIKALWGKILSPSNKREGDEESRVPWSGQGRTRLSRWEDRQSHPNLVICHAKKGRESEGKLCLTLFMGFLVINRIIKLHITNLIIIPLPTIRTTRPPPASLPHAAEVHTLKDHVECIYIHIYIYIEREREKSIGLLQYNYIPQCCKNV